MSVTDLRLRRTEDGRYDLALGVRDLATVSDGELLVQALTLRLICVRGELARLGHPRYGSKLHTLIGQSRHRENLGLLRRYVRKALLAEPRVQEVRRIELGVTDAATIQILAIVLSRAGDELSLEVHVDV